MYKRQVVVLTVGAADERRRDTGAGADALVAGGDVGDDLLSGEGVVVVVVVRVAHDLVPRVVQRLDRLGVFLRPVAHDEECRLDVIAREDVDEYLRILVAPRGVEGDGAELAVRALDRVDRELPLRGGRADGAGVADGVEAVSYTHLAERRDGRAAEHAAGDSGDEAVHAQGARDLLRRDVAAEAAGTRCV